MNYNKGTERLTTQVRRAAVVLAEIKELNIEAEKLDTNHKSVLAKHPNAINKDLDAKHRQIELKTDENAVIASEINRLTDSLSEMDKEHSIKDKIQEIEKLQKEITLHQGTVKGLEQTITRIHKEEEKAHRIEQVKLPEANSNPAKVVKKAYRTTQQINKDTAKEEIDKVLAEFKMHRNTPITDAFGDRIIPMDKLQMSGTEKIQEAIERIKKNNPLFLKRVYTFGIDHASMPFLLQTVIGQRLYGKELIKVDDDKSYVKAYSSDQGYQSKMIPTVIFLRAIIKPNSNKKKEEYGNIGEMWLDKVETIYGMLEDMDTCMLEKLEKGWLSDYIGCSLCKIINKSPILELTDIKSIDATILWTDMPSKENIALMSKAFISCTQSAESERQIIGQYVFPEIFGLL